MGTEPITPPKGCQFRVPAGKLRYRGEWWDASEVEDRLAYERTVLRTWAEREPAIAEALRIVEEGPGDNPNAEDEFFENAMYDSDTQDAMEAAGTPRAWIDAMLLLEKYVFRGLPPGVTPQRSAV